ncbi:MAG TPA: FtsX-like permease family protein, partial [Burkholderiaceae bacterium]|nr:FtsX-like permease family protein [Burkholderiaceae bacterium]
VGTKNGRHFPSSTYLEMTLADSQRLLRVENRVSQIVVAANDFQAIPQARMAVEQTLAESGVPAAVYGYEVLIPIYVQALALFKAITVVVGGVLFVLVGSGIGNVMAMAVRERRREIGTLAAIGMDARQIRRLFLAEGAMAGILGALAGVLLVSIVTWYVAKLGGIRFPGATGTASQGIAIAPRLNALTAAVGVAVPSLVAVIGAWWPAAQAARLSPVEALTDASA